MKPIRCALLAVILVSVLPACTYTDSVQEEGARPSNESSSSSAPPAVSSTMQGSFQSLATVTSGTATLKVNGSGAVLELENMATEPGKDLRVMLSPGTIAPGTGGELELSSTRMLEIGPLRTGTNQRFVMDGPMWAAMREPVRSVLIYDYSAKTSRGAAVLSD